MQNFTYNSNVNLIFGKNSEDEVGQLIANTGAKNVLIHYGSGSIKKTGLLDRVIANIEDAGLSWIPLGGVVPNPRLSLVYKGITLCREEGIDFILAIGGGSVIDSSKAIAAGINYTGDVWELFQGGVSVSNSINIGTILTIPAAGSEVSDGTVITKVDGGLKRAFSDPSLKPCFSILNPEISYTLTAYQTACGIVDMLAHVMERYFTKETHVEVTSRMSEGLMKAIVDIGTKVMDNPNNYGYRAEIMWAGSNAHSGLLGTGRVGDWASHDIEHELSGIYDIAHGAGLSIIFPAWIKFQYKRDIKLFTQWAHNVFDIEINIKNPEETIIYGINRLEEFYRMLNMPTRLSVVGIGDEKFDEMATKATNNNTKTLGNFYKLTKNDIISILNLAK